MQVELGGQMSEMQAKRETLTNQLAKLQKDCRDMSTKEKEAQKEAQKAKQ
jgi:outer membrane murein-binding lipoprotein Lpp